MRVLPCCIGICQLYVAPNCSFTDLDSMVSDATQWLQEFTLNTQMDLERQLAAAQSRALIAEEQLKSLQHYIAQSTLAYQKEIMRLRSSLSGPYQTANKVEAGIAGSDDARHTLHRSGDLHHSGGGLHRSGSAGDALQSASSGSNVRPELRPVRSATNQQGRLPRPMNQRPAVDAWHAP